MQWAIVTPTMGGVPDEEVLSRDSSFDGMTENQLTKRQMEKRQLAISNWQKAICKEKLAIINLQFTITKGHRNFDFCGLWFVEKPF